MTGTQSVLSSTLLQAQAAISPNGKYIAYAMSAKLWIRDLAEEQPRAIEGTGSTTAIFWSPDSKRIGFAQRQNLKTVPLDGGSPELVFSSDARVAAAAWSLDGRTIAVSTTSGALIQVPAAGGGATYIPRPAGESGTFLSLSFLPSSKGARLLLAGQMIGGTTNQSMIVINRENGAVRKLGNGFILFQSEAGLGPLRMLKHSLGTLEPEGEAINALPSAWRPTVSGEGTLVWMDPAFDSTGNRIAVAGGSEQALQSVELSPDGGRVAFSASEGVNRDVWDLDLARSVRTRLTNDPDFDGGTAARAVVTGPPMDFTRSWSPDGETILFVRQDASSGQDVWSTRRKPDGSFAEPVPFLQSKGNENPLAFRPMAVLLFILPTRAAAQRSTSGPFQSAASGGKFPATAATLRDGAATGRRSSS